MAKHAVRVAVRNVVKVVAVPPRAVKDRGEQRPVPAPAGSCRPELLSGVSWDDSRKVWLVHPAPARAGGR